MNSFFNEMEIARRQFIVRNEIRYSRSHGLLGGSRIVIGEMLIRLGQRLLGVRPQVHAHQATAPVI